MMDHTLAESRVFEGSLLCVVSANDCHKRRENFDAHRLSVGTVVGVGPDRVGLYQMWRIFWPRHSRPTRLVQYAARATQLKALRNANRVPFAFSQ